jgi:hypothetical protein
MELTYECPDCGAVGTASPIESSPVVVCRSCARERPIHPGSFDGGGALRSCAWCATDDLYLQKDFPQGLGLGIVVVGFVISTVFWYYENPIPAYAVLLASALLDMVLYYRVPDVTICYRCLGQYRGEGSNTDGRFKPFDLAIGERYRQERMRAEQLRGRRAPADAPPGP